MSGGKHIGGGCWNLDKRSHRTECTAV